MLKLWTFCSAGGGGLLEHLQQPPRYGPGIYCIDVVPTGYDNASKIDALEDRLFMGMHSAVVWLTDLDLESPEVRARRAVCAASPVSGVVRSG